MLSIDISGVFPARNDRVGVVQASMASVKSARSTGPQDEDQTKKSSEPLELLLKSSNGSCKQLRVNCILYVPAAIRYSIYLLCTQPVVYINRYSTTKRPCKPRPHFLPARQLADEPLPEPEESRNTSNYTTPTPLKDDPPASKSFHPWVSRYHE